MANAFKQKFLYSIRRMVEYPSEAKSSDVFYRCLQQIQAKRNVVICIDEIGKLQNLSKYTKNSFFEMVRDLNNPPDDKKHTLPRINFCFSNTSPIPLFDQQDSLPAAQHIALEDFSWDEIKEALLPLFQKGFADAEKKLREIYEWTDGNPQMTCQIANRILYFPSKTVEIIVREIMMDDNTFFFTLNFISDHGGHSSQAKQSLCQQIMTNKNLPYDPNNPLHKYLITAGLLKNKAGVLKIRNKIYQLALLKLR